MNQMLVFTVGIIFMFHTWRIVQCLRVTCYQHRLFWAEMRHEVSETH